MYKSLQAGRAIAAILVVLFHVGGAIASEKYFDISAFSIPFSFGDAGVEFFFVLSGFIIFNAHRRDISKPHKIASYVKKRLIRIYPTYWIIFLSVFSLALASNSLRNSVPHNFSLVIESLLLLPLDKAIVGGTGAPVIIVAWTLQYELLFYLFFALMILNRWLAVLAGVSIMSVCTACFTASTCSFPYSFIYTDYILLFAIGMAVSAVHSSEFRLNQPLVAVIFGVLIFILGAADRVAHFDILMDHNTLWFGLASSLIVLGVPRAERQGIVIGGQKWLQLLGDSSYALYLMHFPLISLLCKISVHLGLNQYGVIGALLSYCTIFSSCLISAVAFHLWVERPLVMTFRNLSFRRPVITKQCT